MARKNGLTTYYHLSQQVKQRRLDNAGLSERNRLLLYQEVNDLQDGLDAIESLARTELVDPQGETFYRILPSSTHPPTLLQQN